MESPPTANRRTKSRWASSKGSTTKSASSNDARTACATKSTFGSKYSPACCRCSDTSPSFLAKIRPHDFTKTLKKSVHAAEQDRPDVAAARKALRKEQLTLDPKQLIIIDETAATTKMTRLYGRAPQGKRLVDKVPHGHWKTTTFICGLRYDGVTAPFVLDGPMDGLHFLAYVEQILAPTLKKGQIVFLDNVSTHKVAGVEEAISARGARAVFLPPYSPDFNPIEQLFAKLKSFLRKMKARTVDKLWKAIAAFLTEVSKVECKAYLANSGYA